MTLMQWRIYSKILMKKPGYQKNKLIFFVKWKKYCYETNILIKFEKNADFIQENLICLLIVISGREGDQSKSRPGPSSGRSDSQLTNGRLPARHRQCGRRATEAVGRVNQESSEQSR